MKLQNFIDYFKACSYTYTILFVLLYVLMNVSTFVNHFYLSVWSDIEELQYNNFKNKTNSTKSQPPRTENEIDERNFYLIVFCLTGLIQSSLLRPVLIVFFYKLIIAL